MLTAIPSYFYKLHYYNPSSRGKSGSLLVMTNGITCGKPITASSFSDLSRTYPASQAHFISLASDKIQHINNCGDFKVEYGNLYYFEITGNMSEITLSP